MLAAAAYEAGWVALAEVPYDKKHGQPTRTGGQRQDLVLRYNSFRDPPAFFVECKYRWLDLFAESCNDAEANLENLRRTEEALSEATQDVSSIPTDYQGLVALAFLPVSVSMEAIQSGAPIDPAVARLKGWFFEDPANRLPAHAKAYCFPSPVPRGREDCPGVCLVARAVGWLAGEPSLQGAPADCP